jgi:alpha-ribazole phosphatase
MPDPSPHETVLWLLRHPEPEAAARGRCYGSLDVALSDLGLRQAHSVAKTLATEPLAAIYSSPRKRCVQAASILATGRSCQVETVDALRELDFGEFEGRSYQEIAALYPDVYRNWMERPTETRFPGGEGFGEMCARVLDAARELRSRHAGQSIALVTHGGVTRILLADVLGMKLTNIFRIGQRYGAVNAVRYFGDTPMVKLVNAEPATIRKSD